MTTLGIIAFIIGLLVSVMLHEAGHLVTAKRFGMKATEFFVGFGPRLWSFRRGETEYGVKAIPAGGYVKIIGMAQEEDVDEGDEPRAFYRKPAWQRAIVLGAGSATHFAIAFVLLFGMGVGLGLPGTDYSLRIDKVVPCVSAGTECAPSDPRSPAEQVGLEAGDRIVAFGGEPVRSWEKLVTSIEKHGPGEASLTVVRDGERITFHPDLASRSGEAFLGVAPKYDVYTDRLGPVDGLVFAGKYFAQVVAGTAKVFVAIPSAIPDLFSADRGEGSPGTGVASVVGVARVTGQVFADVGSWSRTLFVFLSIMVSVNISVGILNLLPLMPLDGGRLAVLGFERARTGLYRLVGRADPGPVDLNKLLPLTSLIVILLIAFGVLLILADIFNPILIS